MNKFIKKSVAMALVMAVTSASFAQSRSQSYCAEIARNESAQLAILKEIKSTINNSASVREKINNTEGDIMGVGAAVDAFGFAIKPSTEGLLDVVFSLIGSWINFKQAEKEKNTGLKRAVTLEEMIKNRELILAKAQNSSFCSEQIYVASLANLLQEKITFQEAEIQTLDRLAKAVEDQRSGTAVVVTGLGAAALIYSAVTWKWGLKGAHTAIKNPLSTLVIGAAGGIMLVAGGYQMVVDKTTLTPLLNDIKAGKVAAESQLISDRQKLEQVLAHVSNQVKN